MLCTLQVSLTRIPEYFNFWDGKPLSQREYGAPTHKRKVWQRPKSDYGLRSAGRKKKGGQDGGLSPLDEGDDLLNGSHGTGGGGRNGGDSGSVS